MPWGLTLELPTLLQEVGWMGQPGPWNLVPNITHLGKRHPCLAITRTIMAHNPHPTGKLF